MKRTMMGLVALLSVATAGCQDNKPTAAELAGSDAALLARGSNNEGRLEEGGCGCSSAT